MYTHTYTHTYRCLDFKQPCADVFWIYAKVTVWYGENIIYIYTPGRIYVVVYQAFLCNILICQWGYTCLRTTTCVLQDLYKIINYLNYTIITKTILRRWHEATFANKRRRITMIMPSHCIAKYPFDPTQDAIYVCIYICTDVTN